MRRSLIGILTIAATMIVIVGIWALLSSIKNPEPDAVNIQKIFLVPFSDFHPEPSERLQYTLSVVLFPLLCAIFFLIFNRLQSNFKGNIKYIHLIISVLSVVFIILLAAAGLRNVNNNYLLPGSLFRIPILGFVFCILALIAVIRAQNFKGKNRGAKRFFTTTYFFVGACLIILIIMETIFNENEYWVSGVHFIAFFDSVVQTYLGKTPLVNIYTQYGLYPIFLKPILQITGLSVVKITVLMGLLKGLAFLSLLLLLWYAVKNKVIAFFGFATIAFYLRLRVPVDTSTDPYFQYVPLRFLFPTVFTFILWRYIIEKDNRRKKLIYWFTNLFCAIAVLWNLDTGLMVLFTWVAALIYQELLLLKSRKLASTLFGSLWHIFTAFSTLALVVIGYCLYALLATGSWPDIQNFLFYTNLFYFYGFLMEPMKPIHPWNMIVLIYAIGLFISIRHFFEANKLTPGWTPAKKNNNQVTTLVFSLCILGIGLFNYYVGRSVDIYMVWPTWPILLLLTLFVDNIFSNFTSIFRRKDPRVAGKMIFSSRWMYKIFLFMIVFFFLASSVLSIASYLPVYQNLITSRLSAASAGMPDNVQQGIELIQSNVRTGDKVLILSNFAPELYLYTNNLRPLPIQGFGEMVLVSDLKQITDFLASPPKNTFIYWDTTFSTVTPARFANLTPIAYSENKDLILYIDKQK